jgi:hypothetical protein
MNTTIKTELQNHLSDYINDGILTNDNISDLHFHAFNEDYYLIGYYQCSEWLKTHNIDTFEAIEIVKEWEIDNFGEFTTAINSESIVNMLVYIYGLALLNELDFDTIEELQTELQISGFEFDENGDNTIV